MKKHVENVKGKIKGIGNIHKILQIMIYSLDLLHGVPSFLTTRHIHIDNSPRWKSHAGQITKLSKDLVTNCFSFVQKQLQIL